MVINKDVIAEVDEKSAVEQALEESDPSEESSPEKETDDQEPSGEDEKTDEGEELEPDDEDIPEGQAIPYKRFKEVNTQRKEYSERAKAYEKQIDEYKTLLTKPSVLRQVMKEQGYSDEKIEQTLKAEGLIKDEAQVSDEQLLEKMTAGLDLTKQKDWLIAMKRMSEHVAESRITPLQQERQKDAQKRQIAEWESQAEKLCKDVYKIDYNTEAIPLMRKYVADNPDDAVLGHAKILKLAMSDKAYTLGEKTGLQKERERQRQLKSAAMEDDNRASANGDEPNENSSISELMAYARRHIK